MPEAGAAEAAGSESSVTPWAHRKPASCERKEVSAFAAILISSLRSSVLGAMPGGILSLQMGGWTPRCR